MLVLSLSVAYAQSGQDQPPLNILLITADDLGLQLGCYGDSLARTPALDALAQQSMLFENAYVTQASCSPSRSSMLTGLYPHQNGQIGLSHRGYQLLDSIRTLPQMLRARGYVNAIIGKLHIKPTSRFPFDYANTDARKTRDVAWVAAQAEAFMDTVSHPFFLMVNYFDPHVELIPQVKKLPTVPHTTEQVQALPFQRVNTPTELSRIANYYSCVARLDAGISMLLETLTKTGQADNTLVIFLGDHGPPFVRAKTNCYEAGLKVPFLVRWPDQPAGKFAGLVNANDIVPTVLEAARIPQPADLPGSSLRSVINTLPFEKRPYLFGEFTAHAPSLFYPMRSVRDERYKLIVNYLSDQPFPAKAVDGDPAWKEAQQEKFAGTPVGKVFDRYVHRPRLELYDLDHDPHEFVNLADEPTYQSVVRRLQEALTRWQQQTHDPLLDSAAFARLIRVHQSIQKEIRQHPDYRPPAPILWTDY